mgnify:CR=1 FL=1
MEKAKKTPSHEELTGQVDGLLTVVMALIRNLQPHEARPVHASIERQLAQAHAAESDLATAEQEHRNAVLYSCLHLLKKAGGLETDPLR